jgi:ribulose 1,5-bisphosphate synthetase/thiazole synthase
VLVTCKDPARSRVGRRIIELTAVYDVVVRGNDERASGWVRVQEITEERGVE